MIWSVEHQAKKLERLAHIPVHVQIDHVGIILGALVEKVDPPFPQFGDVARGAVGVEADLEVRHPPDVGKRLDRGTLESRIVAPVLRQAAYPSQRG